MATEKASGVGLRGPEAGDELFRQGTFFSSKKAKQKMKKNQRNRGDGKSQGMYSMSHQDDDDGLELGIIPPFSLY